MSNIHTLTPWCLGTGGDIYEAHAPAGNGYIGNIENEENAKFLLTAVNNYNRLKAENIAFREALEDNIRNCSIKDSNNYNQLRNALYCIEAKAQQALSKYKGE